MADDVTRLAGNLVSLTLHFFLRVPGASRDKNDLRRPAALILSKKESIPYP
jgi:hypothetical protein